MTALIVTAEAVRAIEAEYERTLGVYLPIGKRMVERGLWEIQKSEA